MEDDLAMEINNVNEQSSVWGAAGGYLYVRRQWHLPQAAYCLWGFRQGQRQYVKIFANLKDMERAQQEAELKNGFSDDFVKNLEGMGISRDDIEGMGNLQGVAYQYATDVQEEFSIVKDTTPNMTNSRLYITEKDKKARCKS